MRKVKLQGLGEGLQIFTGKKDLVLQEARSFECGIALMLFTPKRS